jgi:hypothetical protein
MTLLQWLQKNGHFEIVHRPLAEEDDEDGTVWEQVRSVL